jgi:hypothetical protein
MRACVRACVMEKAHTWHTFKTSQNGDGPEAAAGNDELYLASMVGDHDSIYIFMQQNMSTFEYSSGGWHDIEVEV